MSGNTILITGSTSGIGLELAKAFHHAGNTVIISGRRAALIEAIVSAHPGMSGYVLDIEDAAAIAAFAKTVIANHPQLNVLINNAGIMRYETVTESRPLSDAEATLVTNVLGPIRLTDAFISQLMSQPDPVIVNTTSGLAFVPLSLAPTYSASKAALHSYTVSLRDVLKGKVEVIELVPPAVQTDLTPGQATRVGYLPLNDYITEVMGLFNQVPTPREILVEAVKFLRNAEAEGRFDQAVTAINDMVRKARGASAA